MTAIQVRTRSIQALLEEHAILTARAREIAQRCNSLASIARLPSEVLLSIFAINALPEPPENRQRARYMAYDGQRGPEVSKEVRSVAQVCHFWRDIALGSSALWNLPLDCNTIPYVWTEELLRRSGSMPLTVIMDFEAPGMRQSLRTYRLATNNLHRLGDLEVYCLEERQAEAVVLKRLRAGPTPMLHRLSIICGHDIDADEEDFDLESNDSSYSIYEDNLDRIVPHLPEENILRVQILKTIGFMFPTTSPIYENLSQLHVVDVHSKIPSMLEWFTILHKCSNLVSLKLVSCFAKTDLTEILPQLNLPKLTFLKIGGAFRSCHLLLQNLSMPPLQTLDIDVRAIPLEGQNFERFLEALIQLVVMHRTVSSPPTLHAFLSRGVIRIADARPGDAPSPKLKISLGYLPSASKLSSSRLIDALRPSMGSEILESFSEVKTGYHPCDMQQVLAALIMPFASNKKIRITYETVGLFAKMLLRNFVDDSIIEHTPTPIFPLSLPQINELMVHDVDWDVEPNYKGFERFLRWRIDVGARLGILRFLYELRPMPQVPQCEGLRELCDKFVWYDREYGNVRRRRRYSTDEESVDSMDIYGHY